MNKFILSICAIVIITLSSCSKKDKELEFLSVTSGLTYTVEAAGGTVNVNVETNTDYFVSIPDDAKDWISVGESRASRHETISLSISENGIEARYAIVYLNNKNGEQLAKIQISQKGEDPCFNVKNGSTVEVESKGGTIDLKFETNIEYSVSIPEDAKSWISVVESRAIRQETVTLSISENGIDARSAFIYLIDKKGEQLAKIQISQKGEDPCFNVKNGSTVEVESKGGTVDLKFETNIEYSVSIPEDAKSWISIVESRAIRQETVTLSISENNGASRSATIQFVDKNEKILASIEIKQVEGLISIEIPSDMTIAFPDENFRNYLLKNFDNDNDGVISDVEAFRIREINVSVAYYDPIKIASLEGIQYFPNLEFLNCSCNQLTTIDVSKNTSLITLICDRNKLTALDVIKNTALTHLNCQENRLTMLNVSNNTVLEYLHCEENQLTKLDVSKNTALTYLGCDSNQLTTLDVSKNTALTYLSCDRNQLTTLDVSKNTALSGLSCNYNQLTTLDISKNTALTHLNCQHNQLTMLDVSYNTVLEYLYCNANQLTTLDVSKNTALTLLHCDNNQLTILDVSKSPALTQLYCWNNELTNLDVSNNTALTHLLCWYNKLTILDVSKTNLGNSLEKTPLQCIMPSLKTLYLKTGWEIEGVNINDEYGNYRGVDIIYVD
ncbi:MAG: hypothetical protein HDR74_02540 [Bacteroides sp.]|nr:hypothetical protein [Bacteroides sp.]